MKFHRGFEYCAMKIVEAWHTVHQILISDGRFTDSLTIFGVRMFSITLLNILRWSVNTFEMTIIWRRDKMCTYAQRHWITACWKAIDSESERERKSIRVRLWNGNQIEAVYVTWKLKNSNVPAIYEERFQSIHCIIRVFELITRHWSNIRKFDERGAKQKHTSIRKNKNWSNHNKAYQHSAQISVCIAYEILMWIWIERMRADHKQMGESQGKSENDFHYSFLFRSGERIEFTVFAALAKCSTAHMNSLWYFVMISCMCQQHTCVRKRGVAVLRPTLRFGSIRFHCHFCFRITDNLIRK